MRFFSLSWVCNQKGLGTTALGICHNKFKINLQHYILGQNENANNKWQYFE